MYLLGTREKGLLIPAFILTLLALLFWSGRDAFRYFWPLLLIAAGIYLLFRNRNKWNETQVNKMENKTNQEESNK